MIASKPSAMLQRVHGDIRLVTVYYLPEVALHGHSKWSKVVVSVFHLTLQSFELELTKH